MSGSFSPRNVVFDTRINNRKSEINTPFLEDYGDDYYSVSAKSQSL